MRDAGGNARPDDAQQKKPGHEGPASELTQPQGRGDAAAPFFERYYLVAAFLAVFTFFWIVSLVFSNEPFAS